MRDEVERLGCTLASGWVAGRQAVAICATYTRYASNAADGPAIYAPCSAGRTRQFRSSSTSSAICSGIPTVKRAAIIRAYDRAK